MTVRELRHILFSLKDDLQEKEIVIRAEDGAEVPPQIFTVVKDPMKLHDKSKENVDRLIIDAD